MSHPTPDPATAADGVYDALTEHHQVAGDDSHWAFGTDFEDPLAGVDTTLPDDVDGGALAAYCLMLGDDALVCSHRLTQWCSNAPDLEEDIALANIALDLLGQARLLLARAAAADPAVVPVLPEGSPVPAEDALAFFRDAPAFRNVHLAEVPNGDFAHVIVRILLFSTARLAVFSALATSRDPVLAAIAGKGVKELRYHRDYAARWFLTLAQGTEESRRRLLGAIAELWPLLPELLRAHPVEVELVAAGAGVDPSTVAAEVEQTLAQLCATSAVDLGPVTPRISPAGRGGRDGAHTEALSLMLAEMQSVARAHPLGRW